MNQKGNGLIYLLVLLLLIMVGLVIYFKPSSIVLPQPYPKQCTLEAKICPDGSAVGRTGPNCEFSVCPESPSPTLVQNNPINPTPTCIPKPTCLSSTPRCMIPEPALGWCK